jgi:hypothetical protein
LDAGPLRRWRRGAGAGVRKPPKEETAGRKGSGGRDLWGFAGRGWSAGVGPEAVGRRLRRSEGRWRACSIVPMRGLSASRGAKRLWRGLGGHCHPGPARGWKGKRSTLQGEMRGVDPDPTWGWRSRRARAFERLDDDHPAAATRATARRRNVFSLTSGLGARTLGGALRCGERLADALDVARTTRAGEQAVVMMWTASPERHQVQGVTGAGRG